MADNKKQVTITFGGHDNAKDNTLMFEGPLHVAAVLNTLDDIYTFNVMPYAESELPLVVFVRNINDPDRVLTGEIPYRGSFYMYNWDTSSWQQILLGNHSHKNMAILDQLGEVDTTSMDIGERKILTIEKIDPDNEGNIRTYEYKVSFDTIRELPELPEVGNGKNLYLTANSDGKFQWTNSFTPAQTFKVIKIVVDNNFIDGAASKTLKLASEYLISHDVYYNPEIGDEMLVFDSGDLLTDIKTTRNIDGSLSILITNQKPNDVFELNENILILIIRSGITGLIDTIQNQYMTKAEAIDLLTYGTIKLNQYITKSDMIQYAAQLNHTHSQYIRKDEYDIFDYRYADYQHTHSQYITKAQVIAILVDSITDDGEIDTDGAVQNMVNALEEQLNDRLADIYTREQIDTLIATQLATVKNTDAIKTTINGMTLTDYLLYLTNKEPNITHLDADIVELNTMKVNVGGADGIGGWKNGEIIQAGTNVDDFIKKLITKEEIPVLKSPELETSVYLNTADAGYNATLSLTGKFTQNDAGNLVEMTYKVYKADVEDPSSVESTVITTPGEYVTVPVLLNAINNTGLCYIVEIRASYIAGQEHFSNTNNHKAYKIDAGEIVKTIPIYNDRLLYIGGLTRNTSAELPILVDDLYRAIYVNENSLFEKFSLNELGEVTLNISLPGGKDIRSLVIAIPERYYSRLYSVYFKNQNYHILSEMDRSYVALKDFTGRTNNFINNNYYVLSYNFENEVRSGLDFQVIFRNGD